MPDWWEGAVALLALAVSAVSAVYARAAHRLEKQREAKENRPPVKARFTKWLSEPSSAEFKLENRGGRAIDRSRIKTLSGGKLVGFARDESQIRQRERDFGRLEPGMLTEPAEFVVVDPGPLDEPSVKFLATYTMDDDTWTELLDVKLPTRGPSIY